MDPVSTSTPAFAPYAPPAASLVLNDNDPIESAALQDASPFRRFIAALVDVSLAIPPLALYLAALTLEKDPWGAPTVDAVLSLLDSPWSPTAMLAIASAVFLIQATLLAQRGQSIGKLLCQTRIVDSITGRHPGFLRTVVLRTWALNALAFVPGLGQMLALGDVLLVFSPDRRCAHDHLMGTRVIDVQPGPRSEA